MRLLIVLLLVCAGCNYTSTLEHRAQQAGTTNVREVGQGYIQYEIENGTVTCREHSVRSELTCWKNGK